MTLQTVLVPPLLYNKASGYTTSLVTLQGMRTKVSLWNPEAGTFLKHLVQCLRDSTHELFQRDGFLTVDAILGKVLNKPLDLDLRAAVACYFYRLLRLF